MRALLRGIRILFTALVLLWLILALNPWYPLWELWIAHFVALETLLGASALALLVLLSWTPWSWRRISGRRRLTIVLLFSCSLMALAPLITALPVYEKFGLSFSLAEYATGHNPAEAKVDRDVVLEPSRPDLTTDIYHGAGKGPHPAVLVIHGGGWRNGEKGEVANVSHALAAEGYTVFDINYRLAPENRFPKGIADAKCLAGRIRENAERYGLDVERIAYLGRSAGAHMASLMALSAGNPGLKPSCETKDLPAQAIVAIYGPYDLTHGYNDPVVPDVADSQEALVQLFGGTPTELAEDYKLGSTTTHIESADALPATLAIHGAQDGVVKLRNSFDLAARMEKRGRKVEVVVIPLADHGFDHRPGGVGEQLARGVILRFLKGAFGQ